MTSSRESTDRGQSKDPAHDAPLDDGVPLDDEVPPDALTRLRAVCLSFPDAYEEPAWTGIRWRIRTRTFAHVYRTDLTRSPSPGARAMTTEAGLSTTLTFRSHGEEFEALTSAGAPFFRMSWGANVVGMRVDDTTEWDEVRELLTESYCVQAPKRLAARVNAEIAHAETANAETANAETAHTETAHAEIWTAPTEA
ncbi:MmcQ/YjbR family DNA-binding protein [Streptomyces silvensis]|uniref:MmcQ/YjbR family DNA-binding protein n=1 Tax=Streptomyces silvensis TaxID=1765722 RepID=UPI00099F3D37|nr:MmcQ/YjbR family DNA-binding protein [Streptomyces silvensis]